MESVVNPQPGRWRDRAVFVTGHTGFKGSWLVSWLHRLGAVTHGYALDPPTTPGIFEVARIGSLLASDTRADLAELGRLRAAMQAAQPQVLFHLAAQPLVRESYRDPLGTFAANVTGTANVLEAARGIPSLRAIVVITTDKVYENRDWLYPYRESDPLGGRDPYSASKAAAELVTESYRASFFSSEGGHPALVATARAGNVLGGGDWAADRLVPDCLRAFPEGRPVHLRYPGAVRPWQHVLEPLSGYLLLAERLMGTDGAQYASAWNFGPDAGGDATVGVVAQIVARLWGGNSRVVADESSHNPHEAGLLRLDSSMARARIGWQPRWSLERTLEQTVAWHRAWMRGADTSVVSQRQIAEYEAAEPV